MNDDAFRQRLQHEGYAEIERRAMAANESRAEHAHHFDVAALVTAGAITLTCEGRARTYRAGDTFTMAAGTLHAEDVGPDGVEYIVGRRH
ncbi:MAG: AraC family ligand binding domain-containing protein [Alphaproteobacteria bacterium]|nr:AraC family ligand binding domain-containing protein [Alphaproteobacteria bacterium]